MRSLFNRSKVSTVWPKLFKALTSLIYQGLFNLKPTLTLSLINGSLSAVADLLGQTMNVSLTKN